MEKKGKNEPAWDRKNEKENIFTIVWVRTFEYVTDPELTNSFRRLEKIKPKMFSAISCQR